MNKKAIILFSGGLDSTTCLAIAKDRGYIPYSLSFEYDQKHSFEICAAEKIAKSLGSEQHKVVSLSLGVLGGSALTDEKIDVPDFKNNTIIPVTYVPARNAIFLSIALGWAEIVGALDIFIGINAVDYSGYPDCRPDFLNAFEKLSNLATRQMENGVKYKIHAPLLEMTKSEIILEGTRLGVDYSHTVSCYRLDSSGKACGKCDSCFYRKSGFLKAGIKDPTKY
ncbi:7-cyano-7-deazaguanine synthase QueC [Gammaproteobacteria bacterium]|nr:7-cyano-7-deazaguanine synthase QueC [Gammaproteobacteria bacterium]